MNEPGPLFYKDPNKFVSSKEKTRTLKVPVTDLEEHVRKTYSDNKRHEPVSIPGLLAWTKQVIPKVWRRAVAIQMPKEKYFYY